MAKVTIQTADGHYLTAEDGGGDEGQFVGPRPRGLINARGTDFALGAWQEFTIVPGVAPDTFGLYVEDQGRRRWVSAQPDGTLIANRQRPDDYVPNAWELFTIERFENGRFAWKTAHGQYVHAEDGGGGRVIANKDAAWAHEQFTASHPIDQGGGTVAGAIEGQLRILKKSFADATGPRKVTFCSWFPALRIWRDNRDAARLQLDSIVAAGWQGIRVFTAVGGWDDFWNDREVAPVRFRKWRNWHDESDRVVEAWSDYEDVVEDFFRACHERHLKLFLTTGDLQVLMPQHQQRLQHADQIARLVNAVSPEVVAFYEVVNEAFQNGFADEDPAPAREIARRFTQQCPDPLTVLSSSAGDPEEPASLFRWSDGADVCTIHGTRWPIENALERAFSLVYWGAGQERFFPKPFLQGEPTGPNGSGSEVFQVVNDRDYLLALYATHVMTGQATVFFNGPSVRYREPLDATWGFRELPALLAFLPEDIGQWPFISHGNKSTVPISAVRFADAGSGPARLDQVWNDRGIVAVVHGGSGTWELFSRRRMRWRMLSGDGQVLDGSDELPSVPASVRARIIIGEF
jgi:hypothetical protein